MMSFLIWTPDLDTGIEMIDEQHKQLVEYINQVYEANQSGDREQVGETILQLIEYTVKHFTEEEALMEAAGYPLLKPHKMVHQRFVDKVAQMHDRHQSGIDTADELLGMLQTWLFSHIQHNDRGYLDTVKRYLRGEAPPEAKTEAAAAPGEEKSPTGWATGR